MKKKILEIQKYFRTVQSAQSELAKKECLKTLLVRLFDSDPRLAETIDQMSLGAEKTVLNIPLPNRVKTGAADTQYQNVIIEFEKDLRKTGKHALEQLAEYLAGNWKSGDRYAFVLIATDGVRWQIVAPDYEKLLKGSAEFNVSDIKLRDVATFELTESNSEDFFFFLDRFLFKTELQRATQINITEDFGEFSTTFINSMITMDVAVPTFEGRPILETAYLQWKKFLVIAYGTFQDSRELFLLHTYLSIFAKLVAYRILARTIVIDRKELKLVLNGDAFLQFNVERFVENDFYHWVAEDEYFPQIISVCRAINQRLSEYDFSTVEEDILKGVYQELIDIETRHALGEYFTPDWLCEYVVASLAVRKESHFLDPACGSGSFLRAAIVRLKKMYPELRAQDLAEQVIGIDIHPLSVQIAKTTVLLALADKIRKARRPVGLNVYLANSLMVPSGTAEFFGETFKVSIDDNRYPLDMSIFEFDPDFDNAVALCENLAEFTERTLNSKEFAAQLEPELVSKNPVHVENFYTIYQALKAAKDQHRDSIWRFVLQNLYKPVFLRQHFDFVIGNPPWLTYSDVTNAEYQVDLLALAERYLIVPKSKANMPHLEIAAIFLAHSANYFAKDNGTIAFVLPRAFFSADQHDNTRAGGILGLKLTKAWDLLDVKPLFKVPSCVLFAEEFKHQGKSARAIPKGGIEGQILKGRLHNPNTHWNEAKKSLSISKVRWYYSTLSGAKGARSALTTAPSSPIAVECYYASRFKQGATIVPRTFFFVTVDQDPPPDLRDRILMLKTIPLPDAKKPWKDFTLSGRANSKYIFRTALSKNIVPFALIDPLLVLLPLSVEQEIPKEKHIQILDSERIFERRDIETAEWFQQAERLWIENRTENAEEAGMTLLDRLDYQRGLSEQNLNAKYLVLYTASAKDANATVVDREEIDLEFIVESKAYWYATDNKAEADYLAAVINSDYANGLIKAFQTRGLFGPRDVHKAILGVPFPKFDPKVKDHREIAELGRLCTSKVRKLIDESGASGAQGPLLGRKRVLVRSELRSELRGIDMILKRILK